MTDRERQLTAVLAVVVFIALVVISYGLVLLRDRADANQQLLEGFGTILERMEASDRRASQDELASAMFVGCYLSVPQDGRTDDALDACRRAARFSADIPTVAPQPTPTLSPSSGGEGERGPPGPSGEPGPQGPPGPTPAPTPTPCPPPICLP